MYFDFLKNNLSCDGLKMAHYWKHQSKINLTYERNDLREIDLLHLLHYEGDIMLSSTN